MEKVDIINRSHWQYGYLPGGARGKIETHDRTRVYERLTFDVNGSDYKEIQHVDEKWRGLGVNLDVKI